jgi:hypothetical protein
LDDFSRLSSVYFEDPQGESTRDDPRDLPPGWIEEFDEDGDVYFTRLSDGETTRDDPRDIHYSKHHGHHLTPQVGANHKGLPPGWSVDVDDDGDPYWTRPDGSMTRDNPVGNGIQHHLGPLPSGWSMDVDDDGDVRCSFRVPATTTTA